MSWNHRDVSDWLLGVGPGFSDLETLLGGLGMELLRAGAPVWRLRLAMRTVHPLTAAISAIWERDEGKAVPVENPHGLEKLPEYKGSPLAEISRTQKPLRKDLTRLKPMDHTTYHELHARGATDYFGVPLHFGDHLGGILVVATDRAEGFAPDDLDGLRSLAPALAPLAEVHRLKILSSAVTSAYLGDRTGRRVLGGEITRGHIDTIDAAILISDIRNWTGLNAELEVEETVALANRYFEAIDQAVSDHDGEILKFLGDGVLAIFPTEAGPARACSNAMAAVRTARDTALPEGLEFGTGLHFGRVLYGNIGSTRRLDFTVLGQAVNIAARIEALCARTGHPVLYSEEFAALLDVQSTRIGRFNLKGLDATAGVFAPKDLPIDQ